MEKKRKRRRRKKTSNNYFTMFHQEQIEKYIDSEDIYERNKIYTKHIQPVFSEMVDKIAFTYRFTSLPNSETVREECKTYLMENIHKFDAKKGHKAFAYFSAVAKNYFIGCSKKYKKKKEREILHEDIYEIHEEITIENPYEGLRNSKEFFQALVSEMDEWKRGNISEQETKVIEAIQDMFTDEDIEIFNKKAIYFQLREVTRMNSKQVLNNLNKIRKKYRDFKYRWDNYEP